MVVASFGRGLYLRHFNSTVWTLLHGTEPGSQVFWSADSRSIGFRTAGAQFRVMRMRVPDGVPEFVRQTNLFGRGADWNARDQILVAARGLHIGPAGGGTEVELLPYADPQGLLEPTWPHFLPDGEHFIFSAYDLKQAEGSAHSRLGPLPPYS